MPLLRQTINGELWWSSLARHFDLVGLTAPFTSHILLVGNKRSLGSPLFPRQIETTVTSLCVDLDVAGVVNGHTLLPFYEPFLSAAKIYKALACMSGNGNAEFALGLAAMGDYPTHLKGCADCIEEDHRLHGTAVWKTALQTPGAIVCHRHKRPLCSSNVSARVKNQIAHFVTADQAEYEPTAPIPKKILPDALWLAEAGQTLLVKHPSMPGPARLTALYRYHLEKLEYIDSFGRLQLAELMPAFIKRLGRLMTLIQCEPPIENARDNWLARLARYPRSEQSPVKHLLMIRFLNLDALAALDEAAAMLPYSAPCSFCTPASKRSARITEEKIQWHRKQWLKLRAKHSDGSLRQNADTLYSWLWRNDRSWLRYYARSATKSDVAKI